MMRNLAVALVAAALGGCVGPATAPAAYKYNHLANYPGLAEQVASYYAANALESDGDCPGVAFDGITDSKVVGTDGPRTRVAVQYYFAPMDRDRGAGCDGFNTRIFTFERTSAGGLEVVDMSGPRRG
jgi:hypothetical protein